LQASFVDSVLPSLVPSVRRAQESAAGIGSEAVVAKVGPADLSVDPAGFAGFASDGGSLPSLLANPLIETYVDLAAGVPTDVALSHSFDSLDQLLTTQIHDAARSSEQVQMVATEQVTYYVRTVEPGACGRCIILAGKRYKYDRPFLRHPSCRCGLEAETETKTTNRPSPAEIFDRMSPTEQAVAFGVANAAAIRAGADIGRVVNATGSKAGMSTTITDRYGQKLKATYVGARGKKPRLTPEGIMRLAGNDRTEMMRLLQRNGFLVSR